MASPYFLPGGGHGEPAAETPAAPEKVAFKVRTKVFAATQREATISANGTTAASKRVTVRARTGGVIESSPFSQGQSVKEGDVLCKLDQAGRGSQLAQAEAAVRSAEQKYNSTRKLARKNFASDAQLLEDEAKLDAAKAALADVNFDTGYTEIKAPVSGVLVEKPAEAGDLMQPGSACATIAVLDPMLVAVQVSERIIPYLREGMTAKAKLATGEQVDGKISFIGKTADLATRTFRVELEVANPSASMREGVTAELFVPTPPVPSHLLPASVLMLDDEGRFGVRLMNGDGTSRFAQVMVIAQERQGTWVAGLPQNATIITVGQDYVKDGEKVEAVAEVAEAAP